LFCQQFNIIGIMGNCPLLSTYDANYVGFKAFCPLDRLTCHINKADAVSSFAKLPLSLAFEDWETLETSWWLLADELPTLKLSEVPKPDPCHNAVYSVTKTGQKKPEDTSMQILRLGIVLASFLIVSASGAGHAQGGIEIWKEFVNILQKSEFPKEKIRPYQESLREPLLGFLRQMREKATWEEWEASPEIYRVDNQVHFLIPLSFDNQKDTYCFSFLSEKGNWYFQHLESITIRLDKISSPPTSTFPDLPEEKKMWMREEIRVSNQVNLFNLLAKEKGRDFAFNWFKDGSGYLLMAEAWVPFYPVHNAFILYLCWEQTNLYGNKVTLEHLEDNKARVLMKPIYFKLYKQAAHLYQQISREDYRKIFETIWYDRAAKAGWELTIEYMDEETTLNFKKKM
jgi:hypothetical protein